MELDKFDEFKSKVKSILEGKGYTFERISYNRTGVNYIEFASKYINKDVLYKYSDYYDIVIIRGGDPDDDPHTKAIIVFGDTFIDESTDAVLELLESYPDDKPPKQYIESGAKPAFYIC